jgi:intein/homing endonuclease
MENYMLTIGKNPIQFQFKKDYREKLLNTEINWGYGGLSAFTYYRTYSRKKPNGTLETWQECVLRVIEGMFSILKTHAITSEHSWNEKRAHNLAEEAAERLLSFKWTPPGRGLWMMGTPFVYEKGGACLNNCGFVSTENIDAEMSKPFAFLMDMSMVGVGIGFDTKGAGKVASYSPEGIPEVIAVEDSREGWVELISCLIDSYLEEGSTPVTPDVSLVRAYGEPIHGFGGVASGPEPLVQGFYGIKDILEKRASSANPLLTSVDITDIMNIIGKIVVAGNVRRCLPEGTLIHTEQGLIKIEDITPGIKAKTSTGYHKISELVFQGEQEVLTIKTQLGDFECTPKHKIAIMDAVGSYTWTQAQFLKKNDRIVFIDTPTKGTNTYFPEWSYDKHEHSTTCKDITIPTLDADSSWLLGLFHGDGYVYPNFDNNGYNAYISIACDRISYPSTVSKAHEQLARFGTNLNFCDVVESEKDKGYKVRIQSKQLAWYFSKFKTAKTSIDIPKFILQGSESVRAGYLAGLFDADGSYKNKPTIAVYTVYEDYAKQVQALYASLGIATRIKVKERKEENWQTLYLVSIVGSEEIKKFEERIALYSEKYEHLNKTYRSQNDYGFPSSWISRDKLAYGRNWTPQQNQMTYGKFLSLNGDSKNLMPVEVQDIEYTGKVVTTYDISVPGVHEFVAGPGLLVHNTAEIAFGEPEDEEFANMKNWEQFGVETGSLAPQELELINSEDYTEYNNNWDSRAKIARKYTEEDWAYKFGGWRWASNNSIFARVGMDYTEVAKKVASNGEPGFAWLETMQAYGRMKDPADHKDYRVRGGNPCLEQSLEPYELCCLVESFPAKHDDYWDYQRTLKFAYLYAKTVTLVPTHWKETNDVIKRNRRIGTSQSGIQEAMLKFGRKKYLEEFCDQAYSYINYLDKKYSEWLGVPLSIKKTSVKPSGTVSLVAGALPGIHYAKAESYYRLIRVANTSNLLPILRESNYRIEDSITDPLKTSVVYFPVTHAPGTISDKDVSIWEQFANAVDLQHYWADNQVSITISFQSHEKNQIARALSCFDNKLKGVSLLPLSEHGYAQAPYTQAPRDEIEAYAATLLPLDFSSLTNEGENADANKFCDGDACLI